MVKPDNIQRNTALPTVHNKFQPRWLSGDNRGKKRQQDERIHLSWSSTVCSRFVKRLNRTKRSTKPLFFLAAACMVPPRSTASQICATDCWSQSYLVRLLRRQFSSEKSGYQAPPRKQKAKGGSVAFQQGRRNEKWDCKNCSRTHHFWVTITAV